jgi:uncharacterized protein (TIGR02145 family)
MSSWNHTAVTCTSNSLKLYFNGIFIGEESVTVDFGQALEGTLSLGAHNNPSQSSLTVRIMDDFGLWNRALTESEILALYNAEPAIPGCTDPTACNFNAEATSDDGSCVLNSFADWNWIESDTILHLPGTTTQLYVSPPHDGENPEEAWYQTYPANGASGGFGQACALEDKVYVSGATWPGSTTDQLMTCISPEGELIWQEVRSPGGDHDGFFSVLVNEEVLWYGSQNAQGTGYVDAAWITTDLDGNETSFHFSPVGGTSGGEELLELASGTIVASHKRWPDGKAMILDESYNVSHESPWFNMGSYCRPQLTASDDVNSFFLLGAANNSNITIRRYNESMEELSNWDVSFDQSIYIEDAIWSGDAIVIAGKTMPDSKGVLLKVNSTGIIDEYVENENSCFYTLYQTSGHLWTTRTSGINPNHTSTMVGRIENGLEFNSTLMLNDGNPFVPRGMTGINNELYVSGTDGTTAWQADAPAVSKIVIPDIPEVSTTPFMAEWSNNITGDTIEIQPITSQWFNVNVSLGNCSWQDSIFVLIATPGCTDSTACNFDTEATGDDGSCTYPPFGLTDCDEGGSLCADGTTWNSATQSCDPLPCQAEADAASCGPGTYWDELESLCLPIETCEDDLDGDGVIGVNDLMQLLSTFGTDCAPADDPSGDPETAEFTCGDPISYHGYDYATVQIGEQCWFAENLRHLPEVSPVALGSEDDGLPHAYVYGYNGSSPEEAMLTANYSTYGALYNYETIDEWNLCPEGWSNPTLEKWNVLTSGHTASECVSVEWFGNNQTGFNLLPGGDRDGVEGFNAFHNIGNAGLIWISENPPKHVGVLNQNWYEYENATLPSFGFSVRCLKDQ